MSAIKVEGITGWDGFYELSEGDRAFNAREWRWIKEFSGWMRANIQDGFAGEDPGLFIIVAVIAMVRCGKVHRDDALKAAAEMAEVPYTDAMITLVPESSEAEEDELPLDLTSQPAEPSRTDSPSSSDTKTQNENSSGTTSPRSSERLAVSP